MLRGFEHKKIYIEKEVSWEGGKRKSSVALPCFFAHGQLNRRVRRAASNLSGPYSIPSSVRIRALAGSVNPSPAAARCEFEGLRSASGGMMPSSYSHLRHSEFR